MKKRINFYYIVALLVLILTLVGCANDTNKEETTDKAEDSSVMNTEETADDSEEDSDLDSEPETDDSEVTIVSEEPQQGDNSNDDTSVGTANENNGSNEKDDSETIEQPSEKKSVTDENESQISESSTKNDTNQTAFDEKDKEKANSLVKDYLRNKNQLIEDENNFVQYDGELKGYIIVRYSTLVSGHSSTNGRYAVDIKSGEILDVTADVDFFN